MLEESLAKTKVFAAFLPETSRERVLDLVSTEAKRLKMCRELQAMMPTFTHAILGGIIGLLFLFLTRSAHHRFNERSVILLAFNSLIGPDFMKIPRLFFFQDNVILKELDIFLHSAVGWVAWSFAISLILWPLCNIKARYPESVTYFNTVKVIAAAGIMHQGLDVLDTSAGGYGSLRIVPWVDATRVNLDLFNTGWTYPDGLLSLPSRTLGMGALFLIGLGFLVLLSWLLLKKKMKATLVAALLFVVTVVTIVLLFGSRIVAHEHDLGYLLYAGLYFVLPLCSLAWACQDVRLQLDSKCIFANAMLANKKKDAMESKEKE